MQAKLIDGKAIAAKIENEIREQVLKMDKPPVIVSYFGCQIPNLGEQVY